MTNSPDPIMLKIQTQLLKATFLNNMAILKKIMPEIYNYYLNYTPNNAQLTFDDSGRVNMMAAGQLVYQGDPKVESQAQVEAFLKKPPRFDFEVAAVESDDFIYDHEKVIHKIFNKKRELLKNKKTAKLEKKGQINFLTIMGSGLGYHLEYLFEQFSIRSAFIYEPEPDCFFATLHCIDILPLFEHCQLHGGDLTFKIGGGVESYVNEISTSLKNQGNFNIAKMYLYRHYFSDKTTQAFKLINELAYRYRSGWGFCEDEIIGISHTLTNISKNKYPTILQTAKSHKKDQPVFVIGNGPSLDNSFEYLKKNQHSAVIISCGTALKPLLDNGITPDLHIEQERPAMIYDWIKKVGHEEKLKTIDLICLNTVYPEILHCFKQAHVILKPGDAGTAFIQNMLSDKYAEIYYTNPTVTNAGTAAAISMGFKNLYLFGLDYGFKDEKHHHSKESLWYKDNEGLKEADIKGHFTVAGNFGGKVSTTRVFDASRGVLELLLQENDDVICVNSSDGALISFAIPCLIRDLPALKTIAFKNKFVTDFLLLSFTNKDYENRDLGCEFKALMPKFKEYFDTLESILLDVKSSHELVNAFSKQYQFVYDIENDNDKKLFHRFMGGSLNYLQTSIMQNVLSFADKSQQEEYIKFCTHAMNTHFEWLYHDINANFDQPAKI